MARVKDEAIVLRRLPYGESDRIVHLFTSSSGKISAIAKGGAKSLRRFMNTLEPLRIIYVEYFDKSWRGLARIENAHILEDFSEIERDLRKFFIASFLTEIVDKLAKEKEPYPQIFDLLGAALRRLKTSQVSSLDTLMLLLKILELLGFLPNFKTCVHCGKTVDQKSKTFFSSEKGGILCGSCRMFNPYKTYPFELLSSLGGDQKTLEMDDELVKMAFELMDDFMKYHLDMDFRSYRFVKSSHS